MTVTQGTTDANLPQYIQVTLPGPAGLAIDGSTVGVDDFLLAAPAGWTIALDTSRAVEQRTDTLFLIPVMITATPDRSTADVTATVNVTYKQSQASPTAGRRRPAPRLARR